MVIISSDMMSSKIVFVTLLDNLIYSYKNIFYTPDFLHLVFCNSNECNVRVTDGTIQSSAVTLFKGAHDEVPR